MPHPQVASAPTVLRPYQLKAVEAVCAGPGNWIITAPTGSGKTRIFVELARCDSGSWWLVAVGQVRERWIVGWWLVVAGHERVAVGGWWWLTRCVSGSWWLTVPTW